MIGLQMLLAHLVGDYIVQNDWMAANKTNPSPGERPGKWYEAHPGYVFYVPSPSVELEDAWKAKDESWKRGHAACLVHCLCYTLAVAVFCFSWMPWWGYLIVGGLHFPIDRFRFAGWWMKNVSGQTVFATGALSPWSIIIVDNIAHLVTLYVVALFAV